MHRARFPGRVPPTKKVLVSESNTVTAIQTPQTTAQTVRCFLGHADRTDLGREFGATDVVAERGEEGVERVRTLTGGDGTHTVLECVGLLPALETALAVVRDGGTVSRVGAPQYSQAPLDFGPFMRNITLTGGVAPARAYIEELMPDVLDGTIQPGRVFDRAISLEEIPDGYRAMADREAIKVVVQP